MSATVLMGAIITIRYHKKWKFYYDNWIGYQRETRKHTSTGVKRKS